MNALVCCEVLARVPAGQGGPLIVRADECRTAQRDRRAEARVERRRVRGRGVRSRREIPVGEQTPWQGGAPEKASFRSDADPHEQLSAIVSVRAYAPEQRQKCWCERAQLKAARHELK